MCHAGKMSDLRVRVCASERVRVCVKRSASPPLKLPLFTWHAAANAGTDGVKHTHTHTHTFLKKKKPTQLWSAFGTRGMLTLCVEMVNESSVFAVASLCIHCAKLTAGFCSGNSAPKILITPSPFFFHECLAIVSSDLFLFYFPLSLDNI